MENQVFRKKSLAARSAPEDLNDYLHVTRPAIWIVLIAVIVLVLSMLLWSTFVTIDSKATGKAVVENGTVLITFDDPNLARNVTDDMSAVIGNVTVPLTSVGTDMDGRIVAGGTTTELQDATYDCSVTYRRTKALSILFN